MKLRSLVKWSAKTLMIFGPFISVLGFIPNLIHHLASGYPKIYGPLLIYEISEQAIAVLSCIALGGGVLALLDIDERLRSHILNAEFGDH